jgi:hypothetical protein
MDASTGVLFYPEHPDGRAIPVRPLASTDLSGDARRSFHFGLVQSTPTASVVAADQQHSLHARAMTPASHGALQHDEIHFRIPKLSYRLLDGSTSSFARLSYLAQTRGGSRHCKARATRYRRRIHARVRSLYRYLNTIHSAADLDGQLIYAKRLQRRHDKAVESLHRRMSSLSSCGLEFHEQDLRKIYYFPVGFPPGVPNPLPFFPDTTVLRQRAFDLNYPHSLRNLLLENSLGRMDIYGHIGDTITVRPVSAYCEDPSDFMCWIVCPEPDRGNSFECRQTAGLSRVAKAAVAQVNLDGTDPPDVIIITLQIVPGMRGVPGLHLGLIKFIHRSGRSFFADLIVHYPYPSLTDDTSNKLFHEFGHAIGAEHSGALQCEKTADRVPYPLPDIQVFAGGAVGSFFRDLEESGCSRNSYTYTYGDPYCAMGSRTLGHFSAINKERAGWLSEGEIWVTAPGIEDPIPIGNLEEPSRLIKHVKVPIEYGYYYSLEYRTLYGLDSDQDCGTRVCPPIDNAVLVRVGLDPEIVSAVRISSFLPMQQDQAIVIRAGESFTDPIRNLRIELVNGDTLGGTIQVKRTSVTSVR